MNISRALRRSLLAFAPLALLAGSSFAQGLGTWTEVEFPGEIQNHAMAYDSAREVVVLFGGSPGGTVDLGDTWEWDGARWESVTPAGDSPSARENHAMAYDSAREVVVMFGGSGGSDETWEFDGTGWTNVTPAAGSPAGRWEHAMAYDSVRGKVVMFGGGALSLYDDTWEWDGTSWAEVTPAGPKPSLRWSHSMTYDSAREVVVLFGGASEGPQGNLNDTWEFDGVAWSEVSLTNPAPQAREAHSMGYDSVRGRVVMFGGLDGSSLGDTWEFDGLDWENVTPPSNPQARYSAALVSLGSRLVLFGGYMGSSAYGDTWAFDGADWTQAASGERPSARWRHAMAYDSARGKVVMFGGYDASSTHLNDTWEFDGVNWAEVTPSGSSPSVRNSHAMAYDSARGKIVLSFGSQSVPTSNGNLLVDTWEWDGARWTEILTATPPPARNLHAMAYDRARQVVVMFGGQGSAALGDTWEFDGVDWTQVASSGPGLRYAHAMAYDRARQVVVMFGGVQTGSDYKSDTWEFDGANWTDVTPVSSPSPVERRSHAMVYESHCKRVVLFGGNNGGSPAGTPPPNKSDTWEFRGEAVDPWSNLGGGSPGVFGVPEFTVEGPLTAGSTLSLDLQNAPPFNLILAWLSFTSTPFNALGGTIHAFPYSSQILRLSSATGSYSVSLTWPPGIAPGIDLYLQFLVQDFTVPDKITLSNAVTATTP